MKKFLQKKLKEQKGMTLIELLAVIVIIAIIAAIAIPAISGIIENSRVGAIKSDAQNVMSAADIYFADNGNKNSVLLSELVTQGFIDDMGSFENTTTPGTATVVTVFKKGSGTPASTASTISGTGTTGGMTVIFDKASRDNIAAYSNSTRGAGTGTAVGVNASKN